MRPYSARAVQAILLTGILLLVLFHAPAPPLARAGEPIAVGAPFFGTDAQFIVWPASSMPIQYTVDTGPLGLDTEAATTARVNMLFARWQAVPTASITFTTTPGTIPLNAGCGFTDGDVSTFAEFNCVGFSGNPVIYDNTGAITNALFGVGNSTLGFAGPTFSAVGPNAMITGARAVLNGAFRDGGLDDSSDSDFEATIFHEIGHYIGLGHSQINNDCFVNFNSCATGSADSFGLPTMFPVSFGLEEAAGVAAENTASVDDIAWLSTLYPETVNNPPNQIPFSTTHGTISGTVFFSDGITHLQGINVIAREAGNPRRNAVSVVSGYLFSGNPGLGTTFLDPTGTVPLNSGSLGSRNTALIGTFTIPVPAGVSYNLEVENVNTAIIPFVGGSGVGPLGNDAGEIFPLPGTAPGPINGVGPIVANSNSGGNDFTFTGTPPRFDTIDAATPDNTIATAIPVTNGNPAVAGRTISPWVGTTPDVDVYTFTVAPGGTVQFDVVARALAGGSALDPAIEVVNGAGVRQTTCDSAFRIPPTFAVLDDYDGVFDDGCVNDDINPAVNLDSRLFFRSAAGGTFFARVFDVRGDARPDMDYNLVISGAGAAPPPAGCTKDFTGAVNMDWTNGGNWNPAGAPGASDDVCIGGGTVNLSASTTIDSIANLSGGTLNVTSGTLTATNGITVNGGTLNQNGGSISTSTLTLSSGILQGIGTLTANINQTGGEIRPGTSPGVLNVTGNVVQSAAGVIRLEIGGTAGAGVVPNGHDRINISGSAAVDGVFAIVYTNGFTAAVGDTFTVATCGFPNCGSGASTTTFPPDPMGGTWQDLGSPNNDMLIVGVVATAKDFTGGGDGTSWNDANNWTPAGVPINTDNVTIGGNFNVTVDGAQSADTLTVTSTNALTIAGTGSLSLAGSSTIGNGGLVMNPGSSLVLGNPLAISGLFAWNGGAISSGGGGVLNTNGGVNLTDGATLDAVPWNSNGAVNHSAAGSLQVTNGAIINHNTGTWNATGDGGIADAGGGASFSNSATFTRSSSPGQYLIETTFLNQPGGAVNVNTGTLRLEGGGDCGAPCAGTWTVAMNAELHFASGSYQINSSVSGAGMVRLSGGSIAITGGTYNITGTTRLDGGTADFLNPAVVTSVGALQFFGGQANFVTGAMAGAQAINPTSFTFSSGTLTGVDTVNVPNLFTWSGGTMTGGGITNVNGGVNLTGSAMVLNNRTFNVNNSTAQFSGAGQLTMEFGATFNLVGATAILQLENNSSILQGVPAPASLNLGVGSQVQRNTAVGTFTIGVNVNNNGGSFAPSFGTVAFTGAYTQNSGSLAINSGAPATISTTSALTINGGTVDGIGGAGGSTINGNVNNVGGTLRPGSSPGVFNVNGNYTQGAMGTLLIEIGGVAPGTGFDVVNVTGVATLAGTLSVQPFMAFNPSGNFQIMTFGSRVGDFTTTVNGTANPALTNMPGAMNYVLNFAVAACGVNAIASGDWATNATWDTNTVPTGADNVCINADMFAVTVSMGAQAANSLTVSGTANPFTLSGASLSLGSASSIAGAFNLSSGILAGTGSLSIGGLFTWSGGSQQGAAIINANAGMNITGIVQLNGRTLNNAMGQTVTLSGSGRLDMGNGAVFNNPGTVDFQSDGSIGGNIGGVNTFNNSGTLTKSGGTSSVIAATFVNTGTVNANSGALSLSSTSTSTAATFNVGATLRFAAGSVNMLDAASNISGAGTVDFAGGTTDINGTYNITGATTFNGGTGNFNASSTVTSVGALTINNATANFSSGETITPTNAVTQTGGVLTGTDTLTLNSLFTWSGGSQQGAAITNANAGMNITGIVQLNGRTLNNAMGQTVTFSGSGRLDMGNGAVFNNPGSVDIQNDGSIGGNIGGVNTFTNSGTLTKSGGGGSSVIAATFVNTGTVNANSGALSLSSTSTSTAATFNVGATLRFAAGSVNMLDAASNISGAGTVDFAGGTTDINGTYNITGATTFNGGTGNFNASSTVTSVGALTINNATANFSSGETITPTNAVMQTSGVFTGTDTLELNSLFTWSGGSQSGAAITNANAGMNITGIVQLNGRTLNNAMGQTVTFSGSGRLDMGNGAVFNNPGSVDIQNNGSIGGNIGGANTFTNSGTLTKSGGGGSSVIAATFMNSGTVNANNGALSFSNTFTQTAGLTRLNGGNLGGGITFNFNGGVLDAVGGSTITGNVNIAGATMRPGMSPGLLNIVGNYVQSATGVLDIELGGTTPGTQFDVVAITGSATLDGTLNVQSFMGFTPMTGDNFQVMTYASFIGDFATKNGLNISTPPLTASPQATFYLLQVQATADLAVTKTDAADPVVVGENISYTVTVTNNGPSTANNVMLTDTLPVGTAFVSATPSVGMCNPPAGGMVTCSLGAIVAMASETVTIVVTPSAPGTVSNTASVTTTDVDPVPGNNSATEMTTVNQAATSTALMSSVNPSVFGESVTFTATVTVNAPGAGTPTGTVNFFNGMTNIGSGTLNAMGQATLTTSALAVGTHSITATYVGDANFSTSTSAPVMQTVNQAATATALMSSVNPSVFGQSVTFTATVTAVAPGAGLPTGTVDFFNGMTNIGSVAVNAMGQAALTTSALAVGTHSITATYNGDTNFTTSTSAPLMQMVNQAATSTAVMSSLNPSNSGDNVTFTATVTAVAPGAGTPTGMVDFFDGVNPLAAGVALNASGQAMFTTSALMPGTHSITAVYSGDANFTTSTSPALMQTVNGVADLVVTKVDAVDPVNVGDNIVYTVTVSNTGPDSANNVVLTDTLPAAVNFVSAVPSQGGPCTQMGVTVTCPLGTINFGAMATVTVTVTTIALSAPSVTNTASVTTTEVDPNLANNTVMETTTVNPLADLSITKTDAPDPVSIGSNITYTIVVTNNGPSPATGIMVTDVIPAGLNFVSATGPAGVTCMQAAGTVTCTLGMLNSGASVTATVVVQTTAVAVPSVSNTVTVSSAIPDPNGANNSATATTTVNATPPATDFSLSVLPINNNVIVGQSGTYTVTVTSIPAGSNFAAAVDLTCFSPTGPCSLVPNQLPGGMPSGTATLTVSTSGLLASAPPVSGPGARPAPSPLLALWSFLAGLMLVSIGYAGKRMQQRRLQPCMTFGLVLLVVAAAIGQSACATGIGRQVSGPYTVTVTATSGSLSHSATTTLNVTQP